MSLGVLTAAGVVLALFWGDVPGRWIIHWGWHGQPDHWVAKSVGVAIGPLVIGLVAWALIEVTASRVARRGGGSTTFPPEMLAVQVALVRLGGLAAVTAVAGLTLVLPLLHPHSPVPLLVGTLVEIGVVVGVGMAWAHARTRRLRASGIAMPEGYGGLVYRNARDSRLWVPKLAGVGWTINFAHRLAWPVAIALVGVPLAIILVVTLAAAR